MELFVPGRATLDQFQPEDQGGSGNRVDRDADAVGGAMAHLQEREGAGRQAGAIHSVRPVTELYEQGSTASDVFLIFEGIVKIVWTDSQGREVIIGLRSRGRFLGSPCVLTGQRHFTSAITVTKCMVERISSWRFLDLLKTSSAFSLCVHHSHSSDVIEHANGFVEVACLPSETRLKNTLRRLFTAAARPIGTTTYRHILLPLKRKELAEIVAVTPEHLSRLLRKLADEGIISIERGLILIRDPAGLDV